MRGVNDSHNNVILLLKEHYVVYRDILIRWESSSQSLHFSWLRNQTDLKEQGNSTLLNFIYMWRTLPPFFSFNHCSGDLIVLWEQLVYSVMGEIVCISSPKLHSAPLYIVWAKFCYNIFSMEYIIQPITTEHCSFQDIQNKIGYLQWKCRWAPF